MYKNNYRLFLLFSSTDKCLRFDVIIASMQTQTVAQNKVHTHTLFQWIILMKLNNENQNMQQAQWDACYDAHIFLLFHLSLFDYEQ